MKRKIPGLAKAAEAEDGIPDGIYLVRVDKATYRFDRQEPFYLLALDVVEPKMVAGIRLSGRLYCTPKALWKLNWFLRDFGYDPRLLDRDELDEKALAGLTGVVRISHATVNGRTYLNLDAFAPAEQWSTYELLEGGSAEVA